MCIIRMGVIIPFRQVSTPACFKINLRLKRDGTDMSKFHMASIAIGASATADRMR